MRQGSQNLVPSINKEIIAAHPIILIEKRNAMEKNLNHTLETEITGNSEKKSKMEEIKILAARYLNDFSLAVRFSTGITQLVNFLPLFEKYVKGKNLKYFSPERFRKFIVKNGNICWGKNEDIIFPGSLLFKKPPFQKSISEEILYVS